MLAWSLLWPHPSHLHDMQPPRLRLPPPGSSAIRILRRPREGAAEGGGVAFRKHNSIVGYRLPPEHDSRCSPICHHHPSSSWNGGFGLQPQSKRGRREGNTEDDHPQDREGRQQRQRCTIERQAFLRHYVSSPLLYAMPSTLTSRAELQASLMPFSPW